MNISLNWLNNYIESGLSAEELSETLTSVGLEVEEVRRFSKSPKNLDGLVVGEVIEVWQHPNADRLRLTKVSLGTGEPLQIVCGAPNVAKGQKVVVATEGTTLYPVKGEKFTIKRSKIRGEESQGMICAEDEIGIGDNHAGIIVLEDHVQPGQPYSSLFEKYEDSVIEISITPNRVDAASHIGVARDLSAKLDKNIIMPEVANVESEGKGDFNIRVEDEAGCPRYSGIVIKGVKVTESPLWLRNYLIAVGLNPINNIVDASNFVMYELGQPLHTFDLNKIAGQEIIIRKAQAGETIITLDKVERKLSGEELLITDPEKNLALAGVFGGLESGITEATTDIFIESAYFNPSIIRKTSRKFGLFTDASFRYERGTDPELTVFAAQRVAKVIVDIAGGTIEPYLYDIASKEATHEKTINFSLDKLNKLAGYNYPETEVKRILNRLGFRFKNDNTIIIPTWKTDVTRHVDVYEEIMRIYSFDKIGFSHHVKSVLQVDKKKNTEKLKRNISYYLASIGGNEITTLTFKSEKENNTIPGIKAIKVVNPLSDELAELRTSLLIDGLKVIQHNVNRQNADLFVFSWGVVFEDHGGIKETPTLGIWMTGNHRSQTWYQKSQKWDFYTLKAVLENILKLAGLRMPLTTYTGNPILEDGLDFGDNISAGKVKKEILRKIDIAQDVFYAQINAEMLLQNSSQVIEYTPYSKFPRVERDLALVLSEEIQFQLVKDSIYSTGSKSLKTVSIFDVYHGDQVPKGKKSYAIRLTFEDPEKTLSDDIIDQQISKVVSVLEKQLDAKIRS